MVPKVYIYKWCVVANPKRVWNSRSLKKWIKLNYCSVIFELVFSRFTGYIALLLTNRNVKNKRRNNNNNKKKNSKHCGDTSKIRPHIPRISQICIHWSVSNTKRKKKKRDGSSTCRTCEPLTLHKNPIFPCTEMRVNLGRSKRCPILGSNFSKLTFNRRLSILDNKMCMCICHSILSTVARNGGQPPSTQSSGAKNVTPEYFIIKW